MNDDDRHTTLLTCSGISHTGRLTTLTGNALRCRHPFLISRHIRLTVPGRPLDEELTGHDYLVAVDGCEERCVKKRMDSMGIVPDCYIIATREGIVKRGMEEPRFDEIEGLSQVIVRTIRNDEKVAGCEP
jgi:uncharacterized metal-binding protein